MKNLEILSIKQCLAFVLSLFLLGMTSCTSAADKTDHEVTTKVPKTTIHEATFLGNTDEVKAHIDAKSDLNAKDAYGSTPLSISATFGKTEIAKLLIAGGAKLNETDASGSTPLHTAAFFGRVEIVKALLAKNVDVSARNNYGSTALESIDGSFEEVRPVYEQFSKDLGPLGLKLDYDKLKANRPVIAELINNSSK